MKKFFFICTILAGSLGVTTTLRAQVTLSGQLRTHGVSRRSGNAFEGGYSFMSSTATMTSAKVKNVKNASDFSQWAYVMLSIRPEGILDKKTK